MCWPVSPFGRIGSDGSERATAVGNVSSGGGGPVGLGARCLLTCLLLLARVLSLAHVLSHVLLLLPVPFRLRYVCFEKSD